MTVAVFWISLAILAYAFVLYPVAMVVIGLLNKTSSHRSLSSFPTVSVIIAACNEESSMGDRIRMLCESDYPDDRLEFVVVTDDGSVDRTIPRAKALEQEGVITHLHSPRRGKNACLDFVVERSSADILIFKDATGEFQQDTIRRLVSQFEAPSVGCVSGSVIFRDNGKIGSAERRYWRLEQLIRAGTQAMGYLPSAAGGIHAMRRTIYQPVGNDITRDMVDPIQAVAAGYFAIKDDLAICYEEPWEGVGHVYHNRIRVTKRGWAAIRYNWQLLVRSRKWVTLAMLFSHKVLRFLSWVPLLTLFVSSMLLASGDAIYLNALYLQATAYLLGLLAIVLAMAKARIRGLSFFGFLLLNVFAFADATVRYFFGQRAVFWKS